MDLTLVIQQILKPILWVLPILLIIGIVKTPRFKGYLGESVIKVLAKIKLPADVYFPIHNVTLPTPDGTTQIDHIFVSRYGVFVVETKNMKGWIFGGEKQSKWTQKIYKATNSFQNPLHQNYKHVKTLESALDIAPEAIRSVVAFIGSSTFKTDMPENVTQGIGYIKYIKSFNEPVLSDEQVQSILTRIQSGRLEPGRATDRKHIENLKTRKNPGKEKICPNCGMTMVIRKAKKGANKGNNFWGCSGYPSCRTVQKVA